MRRAARAMRRMASVSPPPMWMSPLSSSCGALSSAVVFSSRLTTSCARLRKNSTFLRQGDAPFAAQEKRLAQLFFQLLHLPGQGGLGHVQGLGGSGDGLCLRDRQKIAEGPQFHVMLLCRDAGWLMPAAGVTGRQGRSERAEDLRGWPHGLRSGYKKSPPGGAGNGRDTERGTRRRPPAAVCARAGKERCRKRDIRERGPAWHGACLFPKRPCAVTGLIRPAGRRPAGDRSRSPCGR